MSIREFLINGVILFSVLILIYGFLLYATTPIKEGIKFCEERDWNGEVFDTGVKEIKFLKDQETIKFKCSKDENGETDAIIMIVKSIWFVDTVYGGIK